jgi:hypothetical protein
MVESALSGYNNQQVFILDSLLHSASLLLLFIVGDFPLLSFLFHWELSGKWNEAITFGWSENR